MTISTLDRNALLDLLHEAQDHLRDAIENLETYVDITGDTSVKRYMVDHLVTMAGRDHNFLCRDISIDDLIERVEEFDRDFIEEE